MSGTKKLLAALMCLPLLCALCLPALAEEVPYIYYTWDKDTEVLTRHNGEHPDAKVLTGDEGTLNTGWYVAENTLTYDTTLLTVSGDVHLILMDRCSLTATYGIVVNEGNSLSIYAQREDSNMGALEVSGISGTCIGGTCGKNSGLITIHGGKIEAMQAGSGAAIGGGDNGTGTVTIYGGTVSATMAYGSLGAGIGGGTYGTGKVTIYGGTVTATAMENSYGAAIGGGEGSTGTVTIHGGTVTATAMENSYGAAIGGGYNGTGMVTINGGTVTATAMENSYGAAIGGGEGSTGTVTIHGGTVTATANGDGAGIGNGSDGRGGSVSVMGGSVSVVDTAGANLSIGGNDCEVSLSWKNEDDYVTATGYAAKNGMVTLNSSFLVYGSNPVEILTAGSYGTDRLDGKRLLPDIGSAEYIEYKWDSDAEVLSSKKKTCEKARSLSVNETILREGWYVAKGEFTLSSCPTVQGHVHLILADGCSLTANRSITVNEGNSLSIYAQSEGGDMGMLEASSSLGGAAAIGGENNNSGLITIYGGRIDATGGDSSAAIGGGNGGAGTVTILGGTVTATASGDGAGIGGGLRSGEQGGNGYVTIHGGTVTATASGDGAGIGGGFQGSGTVAISGGTVTVTKGGYGEAIGNGNGGSGGSVEIGDGMRVLAGDNEGDAEAALKDDRENACRDNKWVHVGVCPHGAEVTVTDDGKYSCGLCNLVSFGGGSESLPIEIRTEADWNLLSSALAKGLLTGGKWFKLLNDISVKMMIGSEEKPFEGVFDGGGNTLTFNYDKAPNDCAPFRYIRNAEFYHLHVTGTITTENRWAAGLVADALGTCKITNCRSSVTINASHSGDTTHAGFVSVMAKNSNADLTITGCVFDGRILSKSGENDAGFVGFARGILSIKDSLFIPAEFEPITGSANFVRIESGSTFNLENCYYRTDVNSQGKQAYTVTTKPAVSLDFGEGEAYPVSGIQLHPVGFTYKGVLYAAKDETMTMVLQALPDGVAMESFSASAGTVAQDGGEWKLTMPGEDVILTAKLRGAFRSPDFRLPASVTSIGAHAFEGAKMTAVEVGGKCGSIGEAAFRNCGSLVKIRIPANVKAIGDTAFDGCGTVFVFGAAGSAAKTYCDAPERTNLVFVEEGKRGE